jgi:hypothetical protein
MCFVITPWSSKCRLSEIGSATAAVLFGELVRDRDADGRRELVTLADGFRESSQSWSDLLRSCRRRGMTAPVLAVGDGALGFWKALREVFPNTREQRCSFHVRSKVLAPWRSRRTQVRKSRSRRSSTRGQGPCPGAVTGFEADYGAQWPRAVAKITEHVDVSFTLVETGGAGQDALSVDKRVVRRSYCGRTADDRPNRVAEVRLRADRRSTERRRWPRGCSRALEAGKETSASPTLLKL